MSSGRSWCSFTPSRHSKLLFGRKVPFDGPLTCEDVHALSPGAYKCGAVYGIRIEVAGTSLYHQGSADLLDAELGHEPVDVFLAGVTGRQVTPHYWERILPKLDPRVLVPTHYDDFFAPLGDELKLCAKVDLEGVPDEVRRGRAATRRRRRAARAYEDAHDRIVRHDGGVALAYSYDWQGETRSGVRLYDYEVVSAV